MPEYHRSASSPAPQPSGRGGRRPHFSPAAAAKGAAPSAKPAAAAAQAKARRPAEKKRRILRTRVKGKPSASQRSGSFWHFLLSVLAQATRIVIVIGLILGFALFGFGSGMLTGYISTTQKLEIGDIQTNLSNEETRILDMNGGLVDTIRGAGSEAEFVPFSEIKDTYLDDAFIAIEDERFATHPGIDMQRILSAIVSALANGGTPTHGGSTITQQTIKMISGNDTISAQRKIQEWYSAIQLERQQSKDAIMELYLNLVPMSNNYQGVQAAARAYFNKNASELTLAECALLAGIPNRPSTYNPMTEFGRRNTLRRMRIVLGTMLEVGRITPEQYDAALNQEIRFDFSAQDHSEDKVHNWFVETVLQEVQDDLVSRKGYTPELAAMAVYNYGLTIETTMDAAAQAKLEDVFQQEDLFVSDPALLPNTPEHPQAAITVMDNRPGEEGCVRAVVGGFGEKKANLVFNLATEAKRQPGSSIKPILVYTPALEVGAISQASTFIDKPMYMNPAAPNEPYPVNSEHTYYGNVTLEYSLIMSLNTIAADTYKNRLGIDVGLSYLKEEGIDRTEEAYVATALGGFEQGMSTYEMTGAYSVLANDGVYTRPSCYLRVLNNDGTVLLDNTQRESYAVYHPATTYVMTQMLHKVAIASWNDAQPSNTIAAGKTGTTENQRDVWFCGYTPYYTAAVWYGYTNANGRNTVIPDADAKNACRIWKASMETLHTDLPQADFARPDGVINMTICADTHQIANEFCPNTINVLLIEGSPANPTQVCTLHDKDFRPVETGPDGQPLPTRSSEDGGSNLNDSNVVVIRP